MARSSKQDDLDRLVKEHLPSALAFATRLTGNADAAEEIVQQALLRVAKGWKSFRGEAAFRTWLFRIVINVFRDRTAAARTRSDRSTGSLPEEMVDRRANDPAGAAQHAELGRRIAAHVSALPPRQREVMVLTAYEGLSAKEVADVLGISESNVYATLHVTRERLRKELAPYFVSQ